MKQIRTVLSIVLAITISGCSSVSKKTAPQTVFEPVPSTFSKSFFQRTITYSLEPKARDQLNKIETLITEATTLESPIPDPILITFYRDADMNRDHIITEQESDLFYTDYIIQFEDSLSIPKLDLFSSLLEEEASNNRFDRPYTEPNPDQNQEVSWAADKRRR